MASTSKEPRTNVSGRGLDRAFRLLRARLLRTDPSDPASGSDKIDQLNGSAHTADKTSC